MQDTQKSKGNKPTGCVPGGTGAAKGPSSLRGVAWSVLWTRLREVLRPPWRWQTPPSWLGSGQRITGKLCSVAGEMCSLPFISEPGSMEPPGLISFIWMNLVVNPSHQSPRSPGRGLPLSRSTVPPPIPPVPVPYGPEHSTMPSYTPSLERFSSFWWKHHPSIFQSSIQAQPPQRSPSWNTPSGSGWPSCASAALAERFPRIRQLRRSDDPPTGHPPHWQRTRHSQPLHNTQYTAETSSKFPHYDFLTSEFQAK